MAVQDRAVGTDRDRRVVERRPAELTVALVHAADHDETQFCCGILEWTQPVCGEVDTVLDEPLVDLAGEVVVAAGPEPPDPRGVAGDVRLGEHDEPGAIGGGRPEMRHSSGQRRLAVQQHRRLLHDRHAQLAILHVHGSIIGTPWWGSPAPSYAPVSADSAAASGLEMEELS